MPTTPFILFFFLRLNVSFRSSLSSTTKPGWKAMMTFYFYTSSARGAILSRGKLLRVSYPLHLCNPALCLCVAVGEINLLSFEAGNRYENFSCSRGNWSMSSGLRFSASPTISGSSLWSRTRLRWISYTPKTPTTTKKCVVIYRKWEAPPPSFSFASMANRFLINDELANVASNY